MDQYIFPLAMILFFLFCGVGIFILVRQYLQAEATRKQALAGLGFTPVEPPDAPFQQHLYSLYTNRLWNRFHLEHVSRKPFPGGEYRFFDLYETNRKDRTRLANMGLAVISPRLNLPCFALYPRAAGQGASAQLANNLHQTKLGVLGTPVSFEHHPAFDQRYAVISETPDAVRHFLTPPLLDRLAQAPAFRIVAGGDTFTVEREEYHNHRPNTLTPADLRQVQADAQGLFTLFTSPG